MSRGVRPLPSPPPEASCPRSGACWTTVVVCPPPRSRAATMPTAAAHPSTADTTATGRSDFQRIAPRSVGSAPEAVLNQLLDFSKGAMPAYLCTRDRLMRLRRDGAAWTGETVLAGE